MTQLKRFFVFAYYHFYPNGGLNDFKSSHDSLDEAKEACKKHIEDQKDCIEILDKESADNWNYDWNNGWEKRLLK